MSSFTGDWGKKSSHAVAHVSWALVSLVFLTIYILKLLTFRDIELDEVLNFLWENLGCVFTNFLILLLLLRYRMAWFEVILIILFFALIQLIDIVLRAFSVLERILSLDFILLRSCELQFAFILVLPVMIFLI